MDFAPPKKEELKEFEKSYSADQVAQELEANTPKYSPIESAGRGIMQGATLGFADELGGGLQAAAGVLGGEGDYLELYRQYRDAMREKDKLAEEQNPKSFTTGEIGGGIATAFVPGGAALNSLKGAQALKAGGAIGAAAGLGQSEADLTKGELGEAVLDTTKGGLLGVGSTFGLQKAGQAFAKSAAGKKLAEKLQQTGKDVQRRAEDSALDVLDASKTTKELEMAPAFKSSDTTQRAGIGKKAADLLDETLNPEKQLGSIKNKLSELEELKTPIFEKASQASRQDLSFFGPEIQKSVLEVVNNPNLTAREKQRLALKLDEISRNYVEGVNLNDINQVNALKQQINKNLESTDFLDPSNSPIKNLLTDLSIKLKGRTEELAENAGQGLGQEFKGINKNQQQFLALKDDIQNAMTNKGKKDAIAQFSIANAVSGALDAIPGTGAISKPVGFIGGVFGKNLAETAAGTSLGKKIGASAVTSTRAGGKMTEELGKDIAGGISSTRLKTPLIQEATETKSSDLNDYSDNQLLEVSKNLQDDPKTQRFAEQLNMALYKKDRAAKNAAIFSIMQDPIARARLKVTP